MAAARDLPTSKNLVNWSVWAAEAFWSSLPVIVAVDVECLFPNDSNDEAPQKLMPLQKKKFNLLKAFKFQGCLKTINNFRGLSWTFSPKY